MASRRVRSSLFAFAMLLAGTIVISMPAAASSGSAAAPAAGTYETPAGVGANGAQVVNRSHSGTGDSSPVGAISQPKNVTMSAPGLVTSFSGLNHFDQRFGSSAGGNQFSLEPPDQGLCVGSDGSNVRVVEAVNDVMQVFDTSGHPITAPEALNQFFGYAPAIVRSPLTFGPFVTDPSCLYDAPTGRWFIDVLTLDTFPQLGDDGLQHFTGTNHLDLAVSDTSDPTGTWSIFRIPVQDDGSAVTPNHHCSDGASKSLPVPTNPTACFGDYPHIGSNADGIFLTTNEYSFFGPEFHGAQIYAFSKAALESGTAAPVQFDTHGLDTFGFGLNGFTLWPSVTPTAAGYGAGDSSNGGTEYFLSSNGGAEAHDTGNGKSTFEPSTQLLVWSLTNTSSLSSASPAVSLTNAQLTVGRYTLPPSAEQKSGNQPLRTCLNSSSCSLFLEGVKDPFAEKSANLDSNDTRMQQVTWLNGSLWGAIDTGVNTSNHKQAGIEWFKASATGGATGATLAGSGFVALGNDNLTYPAIGITTAGTGVMAFTVVGSDFYPSAGYATITGGGVSDIHIAAAGLGPDDGFTDYRLFANPPSFTARPRWGDYGAAVPYGSSVWMASEYIGQSCDLATFLATSFRCGNTRTALANWDTRISEVTP